MTGARVIERTIKPTKERRRQSLGGIERVDKQIADANGDIGHPWQAISLLSQLQRRGAINEPMRLAGEEFHRLFHLAALDPLRAADMSREPQGYGGVIVMPGSEAAHRKIKAALNALGGLGSSTGNCAYFVLGLDLSLRQFAARQQWRGANPHEAKGVLRSTLDLLVKHFGY